MSIMSRKHFSLAKMTRKAALLLLQFCCLVCGYFSIDSSDYEEIPAGNWFPFVYVSRLSVPGGNRILIWKNSTIFLSAPDGVWYASNEPTGWFGWVALLIDGTTLTNCQEMAFDEDEQVLAKAAIFKGHSQFIFAACDGGFARWEIWDYHTVISGRFLACNGISINFQS